MVQPGIRSHLGFHIQHLDFGLLALPRLESYESVSSQVDWFMDLQTANGWYLAYDFANGLVPRTHQAVICQSQSPGKCSSFQSKDAYEDVRMFHIVQA